LWWGINKAKAKDEEKYEQMKVPEN